MTQKLYLYFDSGVKYKHDDFGCYIIIGDGYRMQPILFAMNHWDRKKDEIDATNEDLMITYFKKELFKFNLDEIIIVTNDNCDKLFNFLKQYGNINVLKPKNFDLSFVDYKKNIKSELKPSINGSGIIKGQSVPGLHVFYNSLLFAIDEMNDDDKITMSYYLTYSYEKRKKLYVR